MIGRGDVLPPQWSPNLRLKQCHTFFVFLFHSVTSNTLLSLTRNCYAQLDTTEGRRRMRTWLVWSQRSQHLRRQQQQHESQIRIAECMIELKITLTAPETLSPLDHSAGPMNSNKPFEMCLSDVGMNALLHRFPLMWCSSFYSASITLDGHIKIIPPHQSMLWLVYAIRIWVYCGLSNCFKTLRRGPFHANVHWIMWIDNGFYWQEAFISNHSGGAAKTQ